MEKNILLNVAITNQTEDEILKYILLSLEKAGEAYYIVTPNPEILVYANKHQEFRRILNNARLALPDGVGVILAGKILGKPFAERVTGVDLLEKLCKEIAKVNAADARKPITVGFLGGGPKIAERTAECLTRKYPGLNVVLAASEWPSPSLRGASATKQSNSVIPSAVEGSSNKKIATPSACNDKSQLDVPVDILFVAFGFPKQEEFMAEHIERSEIPVKIMMGVGGAFDYISGNVSRAPLLIRLMGFEWLYRLIAQPWRIKRQLALVEFMYLVLKNGIICML